MVDSATENRCSKLNNIVISTSLIYLAIPVLLFLFGWLKLPYAIISSVLLILGLFYSIKNSDFIDISFSNLKKLDWIILFIVSFAWVYLSGIGGFVFQNTDHEYRNAFLEILVKLDWPITAQFGNEIFSFVYYFAIWLPAALVGKVAGLAAAEVFLYLWCSFGVLLGLSFIAAKSKIKPIYSLIIFILFSGLDVVGDYLANTADDYTIFSIDHIEFAWSEYIFQYSSHTTQLFWVFNQAIPAWLITLMMFNSKNNKSILFVYSLCFLFATLPAIGLLPILIFVSVINSISENNSNKSFKEKAIEFLKSFITFQNISGLVIIAISYLFLSTNAAGKIGLLQGNSSFWFLYIQFVVLEVMVFFIPMYSAQKKNFWYWASLVVLTIIPPITVGGLYDFCMRVSIPWLIILFTMVTDSLSVYAKNKNKVMLAALLLVLLIGSVTPLHEICRTLVITYENKQKNLPVKAKTADLMKEFGSNFWGMKKNSLFFKYLAK